MDVEKLEILDKLKKINPLCFPSSIKNFIDSIGLEATLKIYVAYSGSHLAIPITNTKSGYLEDLIGDQAFKKLISTYGDEVTQIPSVFKFLNDRKIRSRNDSIFNEWSNGASQGSLAIKHSITERTVNAIISKYKT